MLSCPEFKSSGWAGKNWYSANLVPSFVHCFPFVQGDEFCVVDARAHVAGSRRPPLPSPNVIANGGRQDGISNSTMPQGAGGGFVLDGLGECSEGKTNCTWACGDSETNGPFGWR